jgi:hypothetical protein
MSSYHGKPSGVDVKIDQDFSFDLDQSTSLDVDTSSKNELDYDIDVDAKDAKVKVDIDIDRDESIKSETTVKYEETVKQDIDIDIDENVDKNVNIDVWNMEVNVKAENIEYGVLHDVDTNDIDSSRLLDVGPGATVNMNDFSARQLAAGNSFNGAGNDSLFSARQSNSMVDNDSLTNPVVAYGGIIHEAALRPGPGHDDHGPKGGGDPFQTVDADGGHAKADDGIDGRIESSAIGNAGSGSIDGSAEATADAAANVAAFTQDIVMGNNTQGNFVNLNVTGGNLTQANDIDAKGGGHWGDDDGPKGSSRDGGDHDGGGTAYRDVTFDDDINDLDASELLNVESGSSLNMDDFTFDTTAIGDSFNGPGNDMAFDVGQVNDLVDNDVLSNPQVTYNGGGGPLQDVSVTGGWASAGDGINGGIKGSGNYNGADGSISGSTSASADAVANVSAFTQNIVMGANLQVNNFTATVVGGDQVSADDITGI